MTTTDTPELYDLLTSLGVQITGVGVSEIGARCPVHIQTTGHEDHSPSWSINIHSGLWICYACGAKGTLMQLVSSLTDGEVDEVSLGNFLMDAAVSSMLRSPAVGASDEQDVVPDWLDLYKFEFPPSNMLIKRQIEEEAARRYSIRYDADRKAIIVPIVKSDGKLMGWQIKGKGFFLNYPTGVKKSQTLFGIERFNSKTAILVESPLDVVRYSSAFNGYQALATFGAAVSDAQLALLTRVADRVILAMDNDKAGHEATYKITQRISPPRRGILYINYHYTKAKDIGDMTDDEVEEAINKASVFPPWSALHDIRKNPLPFPGRSQGTYGRARPGSRRNGDGRRQDRYNPRSRRGTARRWRD